MLIRFATHEDIPKLIANWRQYEQGRFGHISFDEAKFVSTIKSLVDAKGTHCLFVAEEGDQSICGVLAGKIDCYYFSSQPIAQMILYWVRPDHRTSPVAVKLMMAFRKWAENRKVAELVAGVTSGEAIDRTDRFFKKMGFRLTGGNYAMPLGSEK
jgi:L-amino acid N-acyltransferase YncA